MSMLRKASSALLLAAAVAAVATPSRADGEKDIKIGTLAPKSSHWGKVFQIWQDAVAEQSQGSMKVTFFWNGSQGDEAAMVDKMLSGSQLDGVACTAVGLSKIWRPILALQAPGLFRSWGALDKARASMMSDIESEFAKKGVLHLGSGDVGIAHIMSKDFEVRGPETLHGRSPYFWADDPMAPILFANVKDAASKVKSDFSLTPKGKQVPEVLPGLKNGDINIINVPALAAQQLQWAGQITHIVQQASGIGIGALVMKQKTVDDLSEDQKKIIKETGAVAAKGLTDRIRKADHAAFESMKKSKTVTDLTDEEKGKWDAVFNSTRKALRQGTFDGALLDKLEGFKGLACCSLAPGVVLAGLVSASFALVSSV